jgi:hypothetical protein
MNDFYSAVPAGGLGWSTVGPINGPSPLIVNTLLSWRISRHWMSQT